MANPVSRRTRNLLRADHSMMPLIIRVLRGGTGEGKHPPARIRASPQVARGGVNPPLAAFFSSRRDACPGGSEHLAGLADGDGGFPRPGHGDLDLARVLP